MKSRPLTRSFLLVGLGLGALGPGPRAGAQNLLPDPGFTSGVPAEWTAPASPPGVLTWNGGPGADGAPGFARVRTLGGPALTSISICVPVTPGSVVRSSARLRWTAGVDSSAILMAAFSSDSACGALLPPFALGVPLASNVPDRTVWVSVPGPGAVVPGNASRALFTLAINTIHDAGTLDLDDVFFGTEAPAAPVEVPVSTPSGLACLALSTALAGAFLLRAPGSSP